MQGDLISRSALIETFKDKISRNTKNSILRIFLLEAIKTVENQPTAYSVEEVEKQIKNRFENYLDEIIDNPEKLDKVDFLLKQNKEICNLVRNGGKE